MKRILIIAVCLLLLSEGTGIYLLKKLNIERKGLSCALGFSVILGILQTLYYIPLLLNLSFTWITVLTTLVLVCAFLVTLRSLRDVLSSILSWDTVITGISLLAFMFVFSKMYIDLDYADSTTYLNYVAMNINAPKLNLYDLSTGLRGQEWDVNYLFQGYYHFASYLCWLVNLPHYILGSSSYVNNLVVTVWGLGILYNVFTSSLIVSAVKRTRTENRFFRFALLLFGLFYANFFYWNIAFAFYGNTFRTVFILLLLDIILRWQSEHNDTIRYLLLFPLAAGFACSSSFLFMSFAIMYSLAGYLFAKRHEDALKQMSVLVCPMVMFVCVFLSRMSAVPAGILAVLYALILLSIYKAGDHRVWKTLETFCAKYGKTGFFIVIPALFAIGSFYIHLTEHTDFTSYSYYLWDFRHIDMITDYLFLHSEWLDGMVNILRWLGVIFIILQKDGDDGDRWMRAFALMMVIFFLDPLCMILLEKTITGMVFYRNFMTLFNPVTEIFFFDLLASKLQKKGYAVHVLSAFLLFAMVMGNVGSFRLDQTTGIYWVYIRGGKNVNGIYKIEDDERTAIEFMKAQTDTITDRQPVTISQSSAALTYIPEAYQIFGPRHYHYPLDRVNEEFYQIARRHEDWLDEEVPDYTKSCGYLREYNVDYVLLQYWQSPEFDQATEGCTVTLYEGSKYKVKQVNH